MLYQALQFPFRGKGSFRHILILALVQLVPIVGQLILLGYGFDIVRALYAGQTSLPPIRWLPALGNGFRFLVAGFFYLLPILVMIAVVGASRIGSSSSFGNLSVLAILLAIGLPLLLILIRIVFVRRRSSSSVRRTHARGGGFRFLLNGLLPLFVTILAILMLRTLVSSSGIGTGKPNGLSILLLLVLALLLFLIGIVLFVGGVRYAIENKGLPCRNYQCQTAPEELCTRRHASPQRPSAGCYCGYCYNYRIGVLFILPGLYVFVICSLALWYMFANYGIRVGISKPGFIFTNSTTSIL